MKAGLKTNSHYKGKAPQAPDGRVNFGTEAPMRNRSARRIAEHAKGNTKPESNSPIREAFARALRERR